MTTTERKPEQQVRKLPTVGTECRDYQHAWQPSDGGPNKDGYWRILHCPRCDGYRSEQLDRWGFVIKRSYDMPDGYYMQTGGHGGMTQEERAWMRVQHISPTATPPKRRRPRRIT